MGKNRVRQCVRGFSFTEIVVAVAILGVCLVPVLNLSTSSVRETSFAREDILARHLLMDLVERFRESSLDDLSRLPSTASLDGLAAGQDAAEVAEDPILGARTERLIALVRQAAPAKAEGVAAYRNLHRSMAVSRLAAFEKDKLGTGRHVLTCVVRFVSKAGKEKRLEFSRLVVRS